VERSRRRTVELWITSRKGMGEGNVKEVTEVDK
jgi:hypothetical protein